MIPCTVDTLPQTAPSLHALGYGWETRPNRTRVRVLRRSREGIPEQAIPNVRWAYFDRRREAIFLAAGDKFGNWDAWYRKAVPLADERSAQHLTELEAEEEEADKQ